MTKPAPPLALKSCPKAYIHDTHRSRTPDETLRFIQETRDLVGMQGFTDATGADRIGIPVFTCDRSRPDGSRTSHTGKGASKIQAQVSLMMESIERYSSEFREEYLPKLIRGTFQNLGKEHPVLDPRELILPQFTEKPADIEAHWVWGFDLLGKREILVPACAVYHPFHPDDGALMSTHTNGLASGNTMEEAVFHALTEVIERDAWSIAKFNDSMDEAVFIEDLPGCGFLLDLVGKFERASIEVHARDITTDLGVPVMAVFSQDEKYPAMMPFDGFGAHLDPRVALGRALMEVAATRGLFIQKHGMGGLQADSRYFDHPEGSLDSRFYAETMKSLHSVDSSFSEDILTDIEHIGARLMRRGFERIVAVDLTRSDVNIPTVRVIVPGMEVFCFDKSRRGERLHR